MIDRTMNPGDTVITPEGKGILVTIERFRGVIRYCIELESTSEVRCFTIPELKAKEEKK